jgi:hypothetical protein
MRSQFGTLSVLYEFPTLSAGNCSKWVTHNNLPANQNKQCSLLSVEVMPGHVVRIGGRHYRSPKNQPLLRFRVVQKWPSLLLTVISALISRRYWEQGRIDSGRLTLTTNEGQYRWYSRQTWELIVWPSERTKLNLAPQFERDDSGKITPLIRGTCYER